MHTLRDINLNLLVVLRELLLEQSVTRAAEKLAMSQSAVSHALSRLRDILDDELFVQGRRGITPTAKALELQSSLEQALHHASNVFSGSDHWDATSMSRTFRIAIADYGTYLLAPPLLARIRKEAPGVDVVFSPSEHHLIAAQLTNGSIHCGCCVIDSAYNDFRSTHLFQERLVCLIGKENKLSHENKLSMKAYAAMPHMVVSPVSGTYSEVDTFLAKKGLKRRVAAVIPHYVVAARAVVNTDMVLTLPYRLARSLPDCSELALIEPPFGPGTFEYSLIWHPRSENDKGHAWLRDIFAQVSNYVARETGGL